MNALNHSAPGSAVAWRGGGRIAAPAAAAAAHGLEAALARASGSVISLRFATALALCLALLPGLASAHLPELFGRDYVLERVGAQAAEPPVQQPSRQDEARLQAELARIRGQRGTYDAALADPLIQLANLQARGSNPVASIRNLEEAIHLLRVNNGLLHPVQLPLLRQLSGVQARIGDVSSSVYSLRYGARVHGMGLRPLSEEGLADSLAYFRAARNRFIDPVNPLSDTLFLQGYEDNDVLLLRLMEDDSTPFPVLSAVAISHLYNLYILLGTDLTQAEGIFTGNDARRERLLTMQKLALGKGTKILDTLLGAVGDSDPLLRAELLLKRANWLQWNGKWRRARTDYRALMGALPQSEAAQALRRRLSSPVVLPEDPALWTYLQEPEVPVRVVARASYKVTARGEARRVEVEADDEALQEIAGQLRRMLRDSHFRPALDAQGPIEGFVTGRRYRVID